jgi:biotin carboxyl carrier protein
MIYDVTIGGTTYRLELSRTPAGWSCLLNGNQVEVDALLIRPDVLSLVIDGKTYEIKREKVGAELGLFVGSQRYPVELRDPRSLRNRKGGSGKQVGARHLAAPMAGRVIRLLVKENEPVEAGQGVIVVEAMKMQNEVKSPKKGIVQELRVAEGASVRAGEVLAVVE